MPIEGTKIDVVGIAEVLSGKPLKVPVHQRSYEWENEQVGELLKDLLEAFESGPQEFFLGSIVATAPDNEDGRISILDGQQRLATTALILAGIADKFESLGDQDRARAVRQYILKFDIRSGEEIPQLVLNIEDDPYFRSVCQKDFKAPQGNAPDSHAKLYHCRKLVLAWLDERLQPEPKKAAWLVKFLDYLGKEAHVIYFQVADDANAYLIFETLNDRGIELSIADLLKNYLLANSGNQLSSVLTSWVKTISILRANGGEHLFTDFLRHYWSSKHEVVRERLLYKSIKENVDSQRQVVEFSSELEKGAYLYSAILSPEHELWADYPEQAKQSLRTLRTLGLEQYRPMLLAALGSLASAEVAKLLESLVNWNVRLLIVGGIGGGVMEKNYAALGRGIRNGTLTTALQVAKEAKSFVPSDQQFADRFKVLTVSKVVLARYYLRTLEVIVSGKDEQEWVPNNDPSKLTLEHVLPENPGKNWPQFTPEEHKAHFKRLGNLCLLTHKKNSDLKSGKFEDKKKILQKSELELTKGIAKFKQWTPKEIAKRQAELADLALHAWPAG